MRNLIIGILCNVFYFVFIAIIHEMSIENVSYDVIESIPVITILKIVVRVLLLYSITSCLYNKFSKNGKLGDSE